MNGKMAHLPYRDASQWLRELALKEANQELAGQLQHIASLIVPGSTIYEYQLSAYEYTVRTLLSSAPDVHAKMTACVQIATLVSIAVSI